MRLHLTLPIVPSVNHCYIPTKHGGRALSRTGKEWVETTKMIAISERIKQGWQYIDKGKVVLELYAYWPDNRRRDMNNMHKLLPDSLEQILYDNDQRVLVRDMDFVVDKGNPRVEVILYPVEEATA